MTTAIFGFIVLFGIRETRPAEAYHGSRSHLPLGERISQLKREPILLIFSFLTLFFAMVYAQAYVGLPLDMQAQGLGQRMYGAALAVNGFLIILVTIPLSNMAAKWPRFETVAIAAILLGMGYGLTALATNLPLFALSIAIWTLGEIGMTTVGPTIIADLSPVELRRLYQGIFGAAWGLAFFIGPIAGGWVYENLGSDTLWIGCLIIGILIAFCYLALSVPAKRHITQSKTLSTD